MKKILLMMLFPTYMLAFVYTFECNKMQTFKFDDLISINYLNNNKKNIEHKFTFETKDYYEKYVITDKSMIVSLHDSLGIFKGKTNKDSKGRDIYTYEQKILNGPYDIFYNKYSDTYTIRTDTNNPSTYFFNVQTKSIERYSIDALKPSIEKLIDCTVEGNK